MNPHSSDAETELQRWKVTCSHHTASEGQSWDWDSGSQIPELLLCPLFSLCWPRSPSKQTPRRYQMCKDILGEPPVRGAREAGTASWTRCSLTQWRIVKEGEWKHPKQVGCAGSRRFHEAIGDLQAKVSCQKSSATTRYGDELQGEHMAEDLGLLSSLQLEVSKAPPHDLHTVWLPRSKLAQHFEKLSNNVYQESLNDFALSPRNSPSNKSF